MTAMLKNVRIWLVTAAVAWLGLGATAWASPETNPAVKTPPCIDPCKCKKMQPPSDSPSSSSCSSCGSGSSSSSRTDSSTTPTVKSIDVDIVAGIAPHGEMENGRLSLHATQPYMGLFSPEGLKFVHPVVESAILSVKTSGLAPGIARELVVKGINEELITFQFQAGSSSGYATDRQAAQAAWLTMTDASGALVTDSPALYVIHYYGTAKVLRYNATTPYSCTGYQNEGGRIITGTDLGLDVVRDIHKVLRQVKSVGSLADIVVPAGCAGKKYEVRFYNPEQIGAKGADSVYAVSGTPFSVVTVENTGTRPEDVDHIRVTRVANGSTSVYDYLYVDAQKMWSLTSGGGMRTEKVSMVTNSVTGMKEQARTVFGPDGKLVSRTVTKAQSFAWGDAAVEQISGYGDATTKTQWSYWDNASETGKYGRVKTVVNSDGSWTMCDYDAQGRTVLEVRPVGDLAWDTVKTLTSDQAASLGRTTNYDYSPVDADDTTDANDSRPRTVTEKTLGIVTGITYYAYKTINSEVTEITERASSQTAGYGASGSQRTTTVYYASTAGNASAGKTKSVTTFDGKVMSYTYELGDFLRGDDFGAAVFSPATTGGYLRTTTQTSPLVAGKSTRSVKISGLGGKTVHEETQVLVASDTWERIFWTGYQLNLRGQVTATVSSDGSRTDTTWGCCNKESEVLADGTELFYYYDALKRLSQKVVLTTR